MTKDELQVSGSVAIGGDRAILTRWKGGFYGHGGGRCVVVSEYDARAVARLGRPFVEVRKIDYDGATIERHKISALELINQFFELRRPILCEFMAYVPLAAFERLD